MITPMSNPNRLMSRMAAANKARDDAMDQAEVAMALDDIAEAMDDSDMDG